MRARWVAKEYKTHARPELYASTPPLKALKIVLLEIATGKRGGKVVVLIDVRRAYFYAPARRRVFVELPPEDYQAGAEHMCGLLLHSLYGTRDAAQNWEEELTSTLSDLKLTRGIACPCVWRGYIKGEDIVATVHGDDITVGGERSAVELLIKMISKRYEIKKQVIGEDPDLEKSGRTLNRVIAWNRDGITIEAYQRHVKGLGVRITPRHRVPWRGRTKARRSTDDDRDRPGLNTSGTTWTTVTTGTDCKMADDDDNDSPALAGGSIPRYRALAARISYLSQDRPDLKFASMQVCCAMARPTMRDMERVKRIRRYLVGRPRARCWFRWQQSGELEAHSDADWRGDRATRQAGLRWSHHEERPLP